ncbi:MAG TPA: hypothetical protein VEO95_04280 [Chthoniobacteraceae bacterium]|nr:hypothetical protein [Chthoniobacteraceae bacterium]
MAFAPIPVTPPTELREPERGKWATPRVSGRYWRRYRNVGRVTAVEWGIWLALLIAFELPRPKLELQVIFIAGAIALRLVAALVVYLVFWRCPSCHRHFTRKHQTGRCEHCGMVFPK